MPVFVWKGRNKYGQIVAGERVATSIEEATKLLTKEQILVIKIEKKTAFKIPRLIPKRVSSQELAIFTRQFAVMFAAGLPLVQALEILGQQQENKVFKELILTVKSDVEGGSPLHNAFRKHPKVFDELFCNMVASGEASGNLDQILQRLASYIEKATKIKGQVKSAMAYPSVILSVAVIIVIIIMWKVVPTFANLFMEMGVALPLPTQITIAISRFVASYFYWMIGIFIGISALIRSYYQTYNGRRVIDRILLKTFVIGDLLRKTAIARFSRTFATLISSGVSMLDALEITAKTAGNAVVEDSIINARKLVSEGKSLLNSLSASKVFPPMVLQMIGAGEQTGALDQMLTKIADFYEDEVDRAVHTLVSLMEPIMIAFIGVIVGGIVMSIYLPIFTLISKF
ncbi:MAG: type II secretion system F family protein [Candidatus Aminicenantia bacterium]